MSDQDKRKDEDEERNENKKLSDAQKEFVERTADDIKTFQRPGVEKRGSA